MHSEKPLSPEPLNAELELLTDDAPPTQGAAVWEDVSGGLHWRSPFNKGRRKEDRMPAEALDALSFGHSLLADSELIAPAPAAHALIMFIQTASAAEQIIKIDGFGVGRISNRLRAFHHAQTLLGAFNVFVRGRWFET